jgi:hypothetical protein
MFPMLPANVGPFSKASRVRWTSGEIERCLTRARRARLDGKQQAVSSSPVPWRRISANTGPLRLDSSVLVLGTEGDRIGFWRMVALGSLQLLFTEQRYVKNRSAAV